MSLYNEKRKKRPTKIVIFGTIITFFTIIGIIASVSKVVQVTTDIFSYDPTYEKFEELVTPLVILDSPTFDGKIATANSKTMIQSAIWLAILENGQEKYIDVETGVVRVPNADIEAYVIKLYGPNIEIEELIFETFDDYMLLYTYNEERESYEMYLDNYQAPYYPNVIGYEVHEGGILYDVIVGYVPPSFNLDRDSDIDDNDPEKFMKYTFKKDGDSFQLFSIVSATKEEVPEEYHEIIFPGSYGDALYPETSSSSSQEIVVPDIENDSSDITDSSSEAPEESSSQETN